MTSVGAGRLRSMPAPYSDDVTRYTRVVFNQSAHSSVLPSVRLSVCRRSYFY